MKNTLVVIASLLCLFSIASFAQNGYRFPISNEVMQVPAELTGIWLITKSEQTDRVLKDYLIIEAIDSKSIRIQFLLASYEEGRYDSKVFSGSISSVDDMLFLNLIEGEPKEEIIEDLDPNESFTAERYNLVRLEIGKGRFKAMSVVDPRREISSQTELYNFVRKNMKKSFFYKSSDYSLRFGSQYEMVKL